MASNPQLTISALQDLIHSKIARSPIYNFTLSELKVTSITKRAVRCRLILSKNHLNSHGSIHGSVSGTIVDFMGGLAITGCQGRTETGLSADIHVTYISGARLNDEIEIEARIDRLGTSLAFTTIKIWKIVPDYEGGDANEPGPLVITGTHTKYVGRSPKSSPQIPLQ